MMVCLVVPMLLALLVSLFVLICCTGQRSTESYLYLALLYNALIHIVSSLSTIDQEVQISLTSYLYTDQSVEDACRAAGFC